MKENIIGQNLTPAGIVGWSFGMLVFAVGVANFMWVHPVPAVAYLLLSLVYLPPANAMLQNKLGFSIPVLVKIALGIILIMFTLGVSDLGDIIDDLAR